MMTISITPYRLSKLILFGAALLSLSALSCFADAPFLTVKDTPYDHQMTRIRPVLCSGDADAKGDISLTLVNHWIEGLRAIPYGFSMEWKTPAEVESGHAADCKGKAVALYDMMHTRGADNLRLVIGRRTWMSQKTHAWLEWTTSGGTYVLDPTINWAALRADKVGRTSYIPLYAYSGEKKYRAAATSSFSENSLEGSRWAAASAPAAR